MALGPTKFDLQDLGLDQVAALHVPDGGFGGETRDVNALRARSLWLRGSVRLLADLVDVTTDENPGLPQDHKLLVRARLASPALLRSAQLHHHSGRAAQQSIVHRVWVTKQKGLNAPVEALTHLLAHAISRQFEEPTTVVTFKGSEVYAHRYGVPGRLGQSERVTLAEVSPLLASNFLHRFFVAPEEDDLPTLLGDLYGGMHRIIYLTDGLPEEMPSELFGLLYPSVRRRATAVSVEKGCYCYDWAKRDEGPFFSSFVASLVRKPDSEPFATAPVDEELDGTKRAPGWRVERDHCRVWLDLDRVGEAWDAARPGERTARAFIREVEMQPGARDTLDRWARGVTNRSVGIALSGGGASSYAMVPLLRQLHKAKVPIDVFSGVSGGAFLGAYYCRGGVEGLDDAIKDGWLYQLGLLPNAIIAKVGQWVVDHTVGHAVLGETAVRFVPVTVKLEAGSPPSAHRVVSGTLGEAVQVSGAAPLLFAPVVKYAGRFKLARYADGGLAMLIPARILRDFGADLLFACNCLPGPTNANPLAMLPIGRMLYDFTFLGGISDLWMSATYMQQRLGRAVNPDVSGFFEAPAEPLPAWRSPLFGAASQIVEDAERNPDLARKVQEFHATWAHFADNHALAPGGAGGGGGRGKAAAAKKAKRRPAAPAKKAGATATRAPARRKAKKRSTAKGQR